MWQASPVGMLADAGSPPDAVCSDRRHESVVGNRICGLGVCC